mmetsp:Transcript_41380/g.50169  ORF Transcript_41380/g.50169 Transcript_41380/m.50169 type:complete len:263 (+) Transcript_41380:152-940(+)
MTWHQHSCSISSITDACILIVLDDASGQTVRHRQFWTILCLGCGSRLWSSKRSRCILEHASIVMQLFIVFDCCFGNNTSCYSLLNIFSPLDSALLQCNVLRFLLLTLPLSCSMFLLPAEISLCLYKYPFLHKALPLVSGIVHLKEFNWFWLYWATFLRNTIEPVITSILKQTLVRGDCVWIADPSCRRFAVDDVRDCRLNFAHGFWSELTTSPQRIPIWYDVSVNDRACVNPLLLLLLTLLRRCCVKQAARYWKHESWYYAS